MKKENKMVQAARLAKTLGYTHIASVVKSVFSTTYHHVLSCDEIIEDGRWTGAQRAQFGKWHGPLGVNVNNVNWSKTISKTDIMHKLSN